MFNSLASWRCMSKVSVSVTRLSRFFFKWSAARSSCACTSSTFWIFAGSIPIFCSSSLLSTMRWIRSASTSLFVTTGTCSSATTRFPFCPSRLARCASRISPATSRRFPRSPSSTLRAASVRRRMSGNSDSETGRPSCCETSSSSCGFTRCGAMSFHPVACSRRSNSVRCASVSTMRTSGADCPWMSVPTGDCGSTACVSTGTSLVLPVIAAFPPSAWRAPSAAMPSSSPAWVRRYSARLESPALSAFQMSGLFFAAS